MHIFILHHMCWHFTEFLHNFYQQIRVNNVGKNINRVQPHKIYRIVLYICFLSSNIIYGARFFYLP